MSANFKKAELVKLLGAKDFDYDDSVPYDRLSSKSIETLAADANLPPIGKTRLNDIRNSSPDFGPQASRELGNIIGGYPSRIMRFMMQFASLGVQYLALLYLESPLFNPKVLEIWNNVYMYDVVYEKRTTQKHRVTAFIVDADGFYFFEFRTVEQLLKKPSLYQSVGGKWDSPILRRAAALYGVGYRLVTDHELGRPTLGNLSYLARVYEPDYIVPASEQVSCVVKRVHDARVVSWRELNNEGVSGEAIRCAVALGLVWYPIRDEDMLLEIAFLYADREAYLTHRAQRREQGAMAPIAIPMSRPIVGQEVRENGITYVVVQTGKRFLLKAPGHSDRIAFEAEVDELCRSGSWKFENRTQNLLFSLSRKQVDEGNALLALFAEERPMYLWPFGAKKGKVMSDATIARCKAKIKRACARNISPLITLARQHNGNVGNHSFGELAAWDRVLKEFFLTGASPTVAGIRQPYLDECAKDEARPTSERTMYYRIAELAKYDVLILRKGKFVAYKYGAYVPADKVNLLTKGRIPGEVSHMDTTPLPNVLINPFTELPATRRAQLALMLDASDEDVVDFLLYYGHPSYRATFRLIIKVVKRIQRLPQYIVVDGGPENISAQLKLVLGRYGVIVLERPVKKPRAGSPVESAIGALTVSKLKNLPGYRDPNDNYRELSKGFRPRDTAALTLTQMASELGKHFNIIRERPSNKTGGESIAEYAKRREFEKGGGWRTVPFCDEFVFLMMPLVEGDGRRTVQEGGCVRNQNSTYSHPKLIDPRVYGKRVEVHEDPDNLGRVVALIDVPQWKEWVECKSPWADELSSYTAEERDEFQEHRRQVAKNTPMPEDYELVLELREWRKTQQGAEAHVAARESSDIRVDHDFLKRNCILKSSGTAATCEDALETSGLPTNSVPETPARADGGSGTSGGSRGSRSALPSRPAITANSGSRGADTSGPCPDDADATPAESAPPPPKPPPYVPKLLDDF